MEWGRPAPRRVIVMVSMLCSKASARAASAYAVSPVWLITTIESCGPITGAVVTNRMAGTTVAALPASARRAAPSSAACRLEPVPTSQMRWARWSPSAAMCTCDRVSWDVSRSRSASGCERICRSRFVVMSLSSSIPRSAVAEAYPGGARRSVIQSLRRTATTLPMMRPSAISKGSSAGFSGISMTRSPS